MSTVLTVTSLTAKRRGSVQRDLSAHMAPRVCQRRERREFERFLWVSGVNKVAKQC